MKRNKFSLSHYKLFSCDMGELIPCGVLEVLPGDTIQMASSLLVRAAPLLAPVMHPLHIRLHHWYVPNRLIWDNFEKFITGGPDGLDATVYPTRTGSPAAGGLGDYLGLPLGSTTFSVLPHRAYNLIWNEYYRDQDLQTEAVISRGDGNDTTTSVVLQNCDWEKDYYTSARPWAQKGPQISLPGSTGPAVGSTGSSGYQSVQMFASAASTDVKLAAGNTIANELLTVPISHGTVNELREAVAIHRYEEARARWGSRYTEYLRYYGVRSSDARLQRPEYLGGGRQTIQWSEVLQTGVTTSGNTLGVGNLRGHGIGAMRSNRFRRFIEEHGWIISLFSARPKTMYIQGLARHWNRRFKEDFHTKELEHIGQQEVLNKEVYAAGASPDATFGYQDRYDEYRRHPSGVAGDFRSTLNFWHMARDFASAPALNATFVSCVPTERTFAVPSEDVLYVMCNHSIQARRPLSKVATSFVF